MFQPHCYSPYAASVGVLVVMASTACTVSCSSIQMACSQAVAAADTTQLSSGVHHRVHNAYCSGLPS